MAKPKHEGDVKDYEQHSLLIIGCAGAVALPIIIGLGFGLYFGSAITGLVAGGITTGTEILAGCNAVRKLLPERIRLRDLLHPTR